MPGAQCTRSLACKCETKHTSVVTTRSPESPGIPARNGFNGFLRALPGVRILGCHRHQRIKVLSTRSGRLASANLTPATGARTTRLCRPRIASVVCTRFVRSRGSTRPAIPARARRCRVHRIPSRVRDDRDTPLMWGGTAVDIEVIWVREEQEYFCKRDWTGFSDLPVGHVRFNKWPFCVSPQRRANL
jgi:hypothetical protein